MASNFPGTRYEKLGEQYNFLLIITKRLKKFSTNLSFGLRPTAPAPHRRGFDFTFWFLIFFPFAELIRKLEYHESWVATGTLSRAVQRRWVSNSNKLCTSQILLWVVIMRRLSICNWFAFVRSSQVASKVWNVKFLPAYGRMGRSRNLSRVQLQVGERKSTYYIPKKVSRQTNSPSDCVWPSVLQMSVFSLWAAGGDGDSLLSLLALRFGPHRTFQSTF